MLVLSVMLVSIVSNVCISRKKKKTRKQRTQIREVESVVSLLVSCFPGVKYAPLYYGALENDKVDALKQTGWNHDEHMQISDLAKKDLSWWLENVDHDPCPIMPLAPRVTLKCDRLLEGWGSVFDNSSTTANARWSLQECISHKLSGDQSSPFLA